MVTQKAETSILQPSAVDMLSPLDILPNPHNPRMFFPEKSLSILKESIRVGILVPLTVYRSKTDDKLHLLDGQRRWMCAKDLDLKKVPVNIVPEPTTVQNIVTMFNIHALREAWEWFLEKGTRISNLSYKLEARKNRDA
jgi:ParB/RepB/Spo0J family partition protein